MSLWCGYGSGSADPYVCLMDPDPTPDLPDPDPYLRLIDPDLDPGGPKTCGSCGSGSPTLHIGKKVVLVFLLLNKTHQQPFLQATRLMFKCVIHTTFYLIIMFVIFVTSYYQGTIFLAFPEKISQS